MDGTGADLVGEIRQTERQGYLKIEDGLIEKKKEVWRKRVGEVGGEGKKVRAGDRHEEYITVKPIGMYKNWND